MVTRIGGRAVLHPMVQTQRSETKQSFTRREPMTSSRATVSGPLNPQSRSEEPLQQIVAGIERQRESIDQAIRQAANGRTFSPMELLLLQTKVYAYSETLEAISHMVDRSVSAVKTTLNTQV